MHTSSSKPLLTLSNVCKSYPDGGRPVKALHDVSVEIPAGCLTIIVGPSGSGKSTLLNLIATIDAPDRGRLLFQGCDTSDLSAAQRRRFRAEKLGFIFQFFNLLPGLTSRQNVELAGVIAGGQKEAVRARATELLDEVGLGEKASVFARRLSGGQMQRVAIARALVNDPRLIVADEPTGNLDRSNAAQIMKLLRTQVEGERAVVVVTHDHDLAEKYADMRVSLIDGCIDDVAW